MAAKPRLSVVIRVDEKVLLTRRKSGEDLPAFWEFPGGKVLDGQTPQVCPERELDEEIRIVTGAGEVFAKSEYRYEDGAFEIIGLRSQTPSADIALTVHDRAEWVPPSRLTEYRPALLTGSGVPLPPTAIRIDKILATLSSPSALGSGLRPLTDSGF